MASASPVGLILAVLSAVFNGSFAGFAKFESAALVHPLVFNLYLSVGVQLSSFFVLPFMPLIHSPPLFCPLGVLAGLLFVGASSLSFVAVSYIGLSTGQGVWGGTAILVAFLWGTLGPPPVSMTVNSWPLSIVACALLLAGVIGIVKCQAIGNKAAIMLSGRGALTEPLAPAIISSEEAADVVVDPVNAGAIDGNGSGDLGLPSSRGSKSGARVAGLVAALLVGVFGGSILVPSSFLVELQPEYKGLGALAFLPSFGFGSFMGSALLTCIWYATASSLPQHGDARAVLGNCKTLLAGMASGLVWNLGNFCQLVAQQVYHVPYGVAYPILQAALVVAGLLGIFVFRELQDRAAVTAFFISSVIVIAGAVLLGVYGPSPNAGT